MVDTVVGSMYDISGSAPQPTVSISDPDPNTYNVPLPPDVIDSRASKAAYGIANKTTITEPDIKDAITNGKEQSVRQAASSQIDANRMQFARERIQQGNVPDWELPSLTKLSDPNSVFEEHYAQQYMDKLKWPGNPDRKSNDNWLYQSVYNQPEFDYVARAYGSKTVAFTEYLNTLRESGASKIGNAAGWGNLIADFASLGLYSEVRGRQGNFLDDGLLLGNNLDQQGISLYRTALTDFDAAKQQVFSTYTRLEQTDPVLAHRWISAIIGQSSNEQFMNNFYTVANVAGGLSAAVRPAKIVGNALQFERTVQATKGMAMAKPAATIPAAVASPAIAGNVAESAVQKVKIDNINRFAGTNDPVKELKERLPSIYDMDKTAAAADPGRLGREMSNRVSDVLDSSRDRFIQDVTTAQRVNKVPVPVTVEARVRQVQQGLADRNRGIDNQVINVSEPLPIPGLNVYAHNVAIGTHDGELFGNEEEAISNANLNGLVIKGSIIENEANLKRKAQLESLIKGLQTSMSKATTPEGVAQAQRIIDLMHQHIQNLPRHMEGVTIEFQGSEMDRMAANLAKKVKERKASFEEQMAHLDTPLTYPQNVKSKSIVLGESPFKIHPDVLKSMREQRSTVQRQGSGFYINKVVHLPLDADFVKDGVMTTELANRAEYAKAYKAFKETGQPSTSIPLMNHWYTGFVNGFFGRMRNPHNRLSITENSQRLIALYGPNVLLKGFKEGEKKMRIPRSEWDGFNRMLRYGQKAFNEETKTPGIWFNTPAEIETWYQNNLGKLPHPDVIPAYFAYKAQGINDLNLQDMIVGQRKRELGIEHHNIKFSDSDGNLQDTGFFEGARRWILPNDNKKLIRVGEAISKASASKFLGKERESIQNAINEGKAKLIQIASPVSRPLGAIDKSRIEYVVVYGNKHQEKPLPLMGNVNRLGGGHLQPEYPWYFKQAHVDDGVYEGDKTIMNFLTKAQAKEALPHMEAVRKAFREHWQRDVHGLGKEDLRAVERLEHEGGLFGDEWLNKAAELNKKTGIPFHKHYEWYFGKDKRLSLDEPIHIVPQDAKIINMGPIGDALKERYPDLVDSTKGDGSLLGKAIAGFSHERDAEGIWTMRNTGTQQNPMFAYEPAPYIDPITTMERSYGRLVRTMYMSDMKDYSMIHWLEQAAPYLKNSKEELRASPITHFNDPQYQKDIQPWIKWQLEANRKQALDFTGRTNWLDNALRAVGQFGADMVYKTTGGKDRVSIALMKNLPKMTNGHGFVRNIAFQPIMGMYALPTFFTQASTFANVALVSPRQAPAAALASLFYGWSRLNRKPQVLDHLDILATQLYIPGFTRWKPGQFKEFVNLMETTGFQTTGNEHAFASNVLGDKIISRGAMNILDWGRLPFNLGSEFTKVGGFATAYLEHRAINPGAIGRNETSAITSRAGVLDHNMSSAFNTMVHSGSMSIPMQFQAYDLKLSQMIFGQQLTPAEKTRLLVGSALLYGAVGGGAATAGFPIANYLTKQVESNLGYVPGENPLGDLIMAGVPAVLVKYLTGLGEYSKGQLYNFSKWGNKGIDPIEKFFTEDDTLAHAVMGPVGDVLGNTWNNSYTVRNMLWSKATQNGDFPITSSDWLDLFNEIRVVSDIRKFAYALNYHREITKNEKFLGDISTADAILKFVAGLTSKESADVWVHEQMIKDEDSRIRMWQGLYTKYKQREITADNNNDPDNARHFARQALIALEQIPLDKHQQTERLAQQSYSEDMKTRERYKYWWKLKGDIDMFRRTSP